MSGQVVSVGDRSKAEKVRDGERVSRLGRGKGDRRAERGD